MTLLVIILTTIIVFVLLLYLSKVVFQYKKNKWRESVEDILKYLLSLEQEGRYASLESLTGSTGLSVNKVMNIIIQIEMQGLIKHHGIELHLTQVGKLKAINTVRAHRLLERYLADETLLPLEKLHAEARRRERHITQREINSMDTALGYPSSDPHGDPIPSKNGTIPKIKGVPLTAWTADTLVRIVHLEDEPEIAYAQILAEGLCLGQIVQILEKSKNCYVLTDGKNEYRLAPAVATNIHVIGLQESTFVTSNTISLDKLKHAQKAEIVALDDACQGFTRRRFLDLGMTPGAVILPELKNYFGDPLGYRIRGTLIALRKEQAKQIWVKPIKQEEL